MSSLVIVIQSKAYVDTKAWDAIRLAGAALVEDIEVRIHLLGAAAEIARKDHLVIDNHANLEELLAEFMECGINASACGKSIDDYHIKETDMISGIEKGSMKSLASWVKSSDHCLTF